MSSTASTPQRVVINGLTTTDATIILTPHEFYVVVQALKEIRETHTATSYNGVSYDTTANIVLQKLKNKATNAITHPIEEYVPISIPVPVMIAPLPAPIPPPVIPRVIPTTSGGVVRIVAPAPIPAPVATAQTAITTSTLPFRKYERAEVDAMDLKNLLKVGNMFYNGHSYHKNNNIPYHSGWKITAITAKSITAVEYSNEWRVEDGATNWTRETLAPHLRPDLKGDRWVRAITLDDVFGATKMFSAQTLVRCVQGTTAYDLKHKKRTRLFRIESLCKCCFFHFGFPIEENRPFLTEIDYSI